MAQKVFKPGQNAPTSGQYGIIGPRGGKTSQEVTMVKGKNFPPAPLPKMTYKLVDKTKQVIGTNYLIFVNISLVSVLNKYIQDNRAPVAQLDRATPY